MSQASENRTSKLHWYVIIALVLAVAVGWGLRQWAGQELVGQAQAVFTFFGKLFLNALKMIIVPLIVSSIITGVASIGSQAKASRLGGKVLFYYLATSTLAILVGLFFVNVMTPGFYEGEPARQILGVDQATSDAVSSRVEGRGAKDIPEVFLRMVPPNVVKAAAEGQMLGLIFFSLLFGIFLGRVDGKLQQSQLVFWQGVYEVMLKLTQFILLFLPIGVFALVANVIVGIEGDQQAQFWFVQLKFALCVLLALAFHALITMPVILKVFARVSPIQWVKSIKLALLTAFSTASSSGTLPVTIDAVERAGVSRKTSSFVLPLGATVNMDGTALYECVAAMFLVQAFGIDISITTQITVVVIALLTSVGVAGVPSASLVAIAIILESVGLPPEALALLLPLDRLLDMCRTTVNVFSDTVAAAVIARSEGENFK